MSFGCTLVYLPHDWNIALETRIEVEQLQHKLAVLGENVPPKIEKPRAQDELKWIQTMQAII